MTTTQMAGRDPSLGEAIPLEARLRVGYIASHYPAVSHSFVSREVEALRRLGVDVETFSTWRARDGELLSAADREAALTTFAVLPASPWRFARAHLRALAGSPRGYASTLLRALRLSTPGLRGRLLRLAYFAEAIVVREHCEKVGVRHLHAQFADGATDVALLVSHYGGAAWTWSMAVHGPVEFYNVDRYRLADKVRDATFVTAISHFGRSQLLTLVDEGKWDKVLVIRCGIEPDVYAAAPPPPAREELRILCVGRLVRLKGQSLLVRAVAELARNGVRARAVLIGDGPKRPELESLAAELGVADRVELVGSVGQDQIRQHYAEADVFCLPSFAEGIPVSLMEAMAIQRPVVTTRIMGIPELVEDGRSGILVAPGDLEALVDALALIAADPDRREELGLAARRKVLEQFDVRTSARRLREIFAEHASARPAR